MGNVAELFENPQVRATLAVLDAQVPGVYEWAFSEEEDTVDGQDLGDYLYEQDILMTRVPAGHVEYIDLDAVRV